jgi:hypothetical protein
MAYDCPEFATRGPFQFGNSLNGDVHVAQSCLEPLPNHADLLLSEPVFGDDAYGEPVERFLDDLALDDKRQSHENAMEAHQLTPVRPHHDILDPASNSGDNRKMLSAAWTRFGAPGRRVPDLITNQQLGFVE